MADNADERRSDMNNGYLRDVALTPLSKEQRQRLECLTAVKGLFSSDLPVYEVIRLTDYLATGSKKEVEP